MIRDPRASSPEDMETMEGTVDVKGHINRLKDRGEGISYRAEDALKLIAHKANERTIMEILLIAFRDHNPEVRETVADTLRWIAWKGDSNIVGKSGAIPYLVGALTDSSDEVRKSVVTTLGFLSGWAAAVKKADGISALITSLKNTSGDAKQKAAWALGEMALGGEAGAVLEGGGLEALLHAATRGGDELQKTLEEVLKKMVESGIETEMLPVLIQSAQNDDSSNVRLLAVKVLGVMTSEQTVEALKKVMESEPDPDIAETAEHLLEKSRFDRAREKKVCPYCESDIAHLEEPTFCPNCGKSMN